MITLSLYDHEIDLVKRALVEFRDAERRRAAGEFRHEPELCSAAGRNADRTNEVFERLLFSNSP